MGGLVGEQTIPSVSRFKRARGLEGVCQQITPPSRNLSEGGVGGDASTEEPPPSHVSSEGGGGGCRQRKHPLRLAFQAREGVGGGMSTDNSSVSQFE